MRNYQELFLLFGLHLVALSLSFLNPTPVLPLVAFITLWLLPGFILWRLVSRDHEWQWFYHLPMAFGLGLAWLMGWAVFIFLLLPFDLPHFNAIIYLANSGLLLLYGGVSFYWPISPQSPISISRPWLLFSLALGMMAILVTLKWQTAGFTFDGDEWSYFVNIRYILTTLPIDKSYFIERLEFDVWNFILAFLIQFAPAHLFEIYGLHLPLIFIIIACLAYLALADTLFQRPDIAYFAFLLQGLYWLSNINLLTADNGLGLLARILQDKFTALLLILPLIQLCGLKFLQSYTYRYLVMVGILAIVAVLIHPIAIMWLLFSLGSTTFFVLWQYRQQLSFKPQWVGLALILMGVALGLAWWQRSTRPDSYYLTTGGNVQALGLSLGRVLFLSLEKNIYMAHPNLLNHPLIILALLLTITLIPKLKNQLPAQFLFANSLAVIVILFNPITASLLGRIISFWIIYRIVWILPISLTLAYILYPHIEQAATYLNHRLLKTPQLASLTIILINMTIYSHILTSWYTLNAWQPIIITATELDVSQHLAKEDSPGSRVLAAHEVNIRLVATANKLRPTTARFYEMNNHDTLDTYYFLGAPWLNDTHYNVLLPRYPVRYILTHHSDLIEPQLRFYPHLFRSIYSNIEYSLYEWHAAATFSFELELFKANGLLQSQPSAAQPIYETILQQNPTYFPAILGLAAIYEQQLQFNQALALYQTATPQTDFERAWLLTKLAQARYHHDSTTSLSVIDAYRQALTLANGHEAIYQQVLNGYQQLPLDLQQSLAGQALRYALLDFYEAKAARESRDYPRQLQLAEIYEQVGEKELAISQYIHLTQQFVSRLEPLFKLAELQPDQAATWYQQALAHETNPPSGEANLYLAQFNYQQGELETATQFAQQAIQQGSGPTKAKAQRLLGEIYLKQKRLELAINALLDAVQTQPNLAWGYVLLGNIYQEQHDPTTALTYYKQAAQAEPQTALYYIITGRALLAMQQTEAGWAEINLALNLAQGASEIYQQVGELKEQYESVNAAYPYFEQATKLNPNNSFAYLGLSRYHLARGEFVLAQEQVTQAFTVATNDPMKASSHVQQAQIYLAQQHDDAALQEFLAALTLKPDDAWLHGVIGDFYYQHQHNLAEAEKHYRQATKFPTWQVSLAEILLQTGRSKEAIEQLQQALTREPNSVNLMARIKSLEKNYKLAELTP